MAGRAKKGLVLIALAVFAAVCFASPRAADPFSTWRPTTGRVAGVRFVGNAACAPCHVQMTDTFASTPMALAARAPAESEVLRRKPKMTFREGPYSYEVSRKDDRAVFTVTDGTATISETILYCFGVGASGQTFLFRHDNALYEGRVSYFEKLDGLDITILHPRAVPKSLEEAVGRRMNENDARGCFTCHTTPSGDGDRTRFDQLVPGVGCEACHGPGEKHIAAVKVKDGDKRTIEGDVQIFNPKSLDAFDLMQEFCGSCHMSFDKVMLMPGQAGLNNIRFQPYRAFKSSDHLLDDPRISCVACHDPHDKMVHETSHYDAKCLACHVSTPTESKTATRTASGCPVSAKDCVTCHMPKVELPEMHARFTDHWIRIAKPGEPVPR